MNQAFELRHGRSLKVFMMDKVSNGPFLEVNGILRVHVQFLLNVII